MFWDRVHPVSEINETKTHTGERERKKGEKKIKGEETKEDRTWQNPSVGEHHMCRVALLAAACISAANLQHRELKRGGCSLAKGRLRCAGGRAHLFALMLRGGRLRRDRGVRCNLAGGSPSFPTAWTVAGEMVRIFFEWDVW